MSVGADIWFSPCAESGDELRPFDHKHFGVYLGAEVKGHFVDNIEVFSLREAEVTALRNMKLGSFDVDGLIWRFRCTYMPGFKKQYPKPCSWSLLPNCMGLAFGPMEHLLYALGFNSESIDNFVAMLEEILFIGGADGPASANRILRTYLEEAEKTFETFATSSRSLDRLRGPAKSGSAFATFGAIKKAAADELRAQQLESMRGRDSERHGFTMGHSVQRNLIQKSQSKAKSLIHGH